MSVELILGLIGSVTSVGGFLFLIYRGLREENRLTAQSAIEAKEAEETRVQKAREQAVAEVKATTEAEDRIAERRLTEIQRLDDRIDELRSEVDGLKEQIKKDGRIIDDQATLIDKLRALVLSFVDRVEVAWREQHPTAPALTAAERALLDEVHPRGLHHF